MKEFLKSRRFFIPVIAIIAGLVVLGTLWGGAAFTDMSMKAGINFRNFQQGTKINYRLSADERFVEQNFLEVGEDGILSLPVPEQIADSEDIENIRYHLDIEQPEEESTAAQTLNLLLDLNKKTGDVALSAKGLKEFSKLDLKNGDVKTDLTADWAGLMNAESLKQAFPEDLPFGSEMIEIAFQNSGIAGDLEQFGQEGKIEVLFGIFGDGSGSNIGAVRARYSNALQRMTYEMSAVMAMQTFIVGTFFDARIQMVTQRKLQELQARAHRNYHPSEQMCRIGTFMRSVAHTESRADVNKKALNRMFLDQYLGVQNSAAAASSGVYFLGNLNNFVQRYCDPRDAGGALQSVCENGDLGTAEERARINKDIDYARTLALPLTLDVNYADVTGTETEEDIIALGKNLYFTNAFNSTDGRTISERLGPHYDSRSFAAKMSVAHSTFINIIGMKAHAPEGQETTATTTDPAPAPFATGSQREDGGGDQTPLRTTRPDVTTLDEDSGWAYMKALMREFGITDTEEIDEILGERPSYYAQMEVLTKKIYQSPNFYTNLYDKPTNVTRIGASLDAILIMHQRDRFESLLRREMLSGVLLEEELKPSVEEVSAQIEESIGQASQSGL